MLSSSYSSSLTEELSLPRSHRYKAVFICKGCYRMIEMRCLLVKSTCVWLLDLSLKFCTAADSFPSQGSVPVSANRHSPSPLLSSSLLFASRREPVLSRVCEVCESKLDCKVTLLWREHREVRVIPCVEMSTWILRDEIQRLVGMNLFLDNTYHCYCTCEITNI